MAAGKNKHLRWLRALIGAYDLSGDARTFQTMLNSFEGVDLHGWSDEYYNFSADGARMVGVRGFQALLNDAAAGAWSALKDAPNDVVVSFNFGAGAEPALGDPAYLLSTAQVSDLGAPDAKAAALQADFLPAAGGYVDGATDNPWGKVLHAKTALSGTTTGTAIDNGAASTNGAHANLHVTASSGGTWALIIEHSSDNSNWSTLMTFTSDGSAITAEQKTATGTVNRYVRFKATRTSGTLTPVVTFARN